MKRSAKAPLRALMVGVDGPRSEKLFQLLANVGIELIPRSVSEDSLYKLLQELQPELIFVDVNSTARDTLEHVVSSHPALPQPVVSADGDLRISLRRLAGDIGISLYVSERVSPCLLQALIDITISHCHSIGVLEQELALLADNSEIMVAALH
ncbi:AmiR/NasT family two-component response regulator [Litorivivens lipolytica]|uniref:AmiR/NasT family two-component response regulator n=1 Tax=Litorivivens lipolytica TaxID=1524264 RepID=A0A7W4W2U4_9GAMM|nr:hypothetical protein [Litorivivens lipolytica]MBB3046421.1 AmiR/NasT family two-component response regulator [Litorivivens lipolytica]